MRGESGAPLRTVLVDDEAPARSLMREYLGAEPGIEVVAECANGFEAVKTIAEVKPDLVFLDVQMPKLDGFEVLELLDPGPAVVFVTAFDAYALRAFEVNAVDYLLKPFARERLTEALARVRERRAAQAASGAADAVSPPPAPAPAPAPGTDVDDDDLGDAERPGRGVSAAALAAAARPPGEHLERLVLRDGARVHVVPVATLDYLEAQDDYVAIHAAGKTWLKPQPLADLARALDPARFVRIHRSYVVALDRIERIEPYARDSRVAVLRGGKELPVSRAGYARLRELMGEG